MLTRYYVPYKPLVRSFVVATYPTPCFRTAHISAQFSSHYIEPACAILSGTVPCTPLINLAISLYNRAPGSLTCSPIRVSFVVVVVVSICKNGSFALEHDIVLTVIADFNKVASCRRREGDSTKCLIHVPEGVRNHLKGWTVHAKLSGKNVKKENTNHWGDQSTGPRHSDRQRTLHMGVSSNFFSSTPLPPRKNLRGRPTADFACWSNIACNVVACDPPSAAQRRMGMEWNSRSLCWVRKDNNRVCFGNFALLFGIRWVCFAFTKEWIQSGL